MVCELSSNLRHSSEHALAKRHNRLQFFCKSENENGHEQEACQTVGTTPSFSWISGKHDLCQMGLYYICHIKCVTISQECVFSHYSLQGLQAEKANPASGRKLTNRKKRDSNLPQELQFLGRLACNVGAELAESKVRLNTSNPVDFSAVEAAPLGLLISVHRPAASGPLHDVKVQFAETSDNAGRQARIAAALGAKNGDAVSRFIYRVGLSAVQALLKEGGAK